MPFCQRLSISRRAGVLKGSLALFHVHLAGAANRRKLATGENVRILNGITFGAQILTDSSPEVDPSTIRRIAWSILRTPSEVRLSTSGFASILGTKLESRGVIGYDIVSGWVKNIGFRSSFDFAASTWSKGSKFSEEAACQVFVSHVRKESSGHASKRIRIVAGPW